MVARRHWTREWWNRRRSDYECVTSEAVLDELERGEYSSKTEALGLMDTVALLAVERPIVEITQAYIAHQVMPRDPAGDALHLALASYHRCDFLLT